MREIEHPDELNLLLLDTIVLLVMASLTCNHRHNSYKLNKRSTYIVYTKPKVNIHLLYKHKQTYIVYTKQKNINQS